MAKYYIVSIGGSGALASESLVHLCSTGFLRGHEIKFLIIDPDQDNSNVIRLQQAVNDYSKIRANVQQSVNPPVFFNAKIDMFPEVWNPNSGDSYNLEKGISMIEMTDKLKKYRLLTNLLFSEDKRKEKLDKGYKGNPMIGTIFMNSIRDSDVFSEILAEQELNMFVFGSLFGGTGAAGLPVIGKTVRNHNRQNTGVLRIGACITLPYFSVKPLSKSQIEEFERNNVKLRPDSATFLPAVKFAIPYYIEKRNNKENGYDSIYFIGCPDSCLASAIDFAIGGSNQNNNSHYINMYSALSFKHFVDNVDRFSRIADTSFYATGVNLSENCIKYDDLMVSLKYDNITYLEPFYLSSLFYLKYFLDVAIREPESLTWLSHAKNGLGLKRDFLTKSDFIQPLKSFMEKYLIWLAQMKDNPIGLKLFNTAYYENGKINWDKFKDEPIDRYHLDESKNPPKKNFLFNKNIKLDKLNDYFDDIVGGIDKTDKCKSFLDVLQKGSVDFIKKTYSKN